MHIADHRTPSATPMDRVRLGNKRSGASAKPRDGEIAIAIDRTNPVLGNPYVLKDHRDDRQRADVISRYRAKYEADIARQGPMARATEQLAERLRRGERLILMCWCSPRPCHGDLILNRIAQLFECTST